MRFRQYLNALLACALLAGVTSCVSDEVAGPGDNGQGELPEGAITFKIAGINTGSVETRAVGDPLIATEAENRVNDLTIFVFTSDTNSNDDADYTYHSYWTSEQGLPKLVEEETNKFSLGGSGQFRTATIVLPKELKYAKFLFLTARPRLFRTDATGENATELPKVYNDELNNAHIYNNHSFEGMTLAEVKALQMIRAAGTTNVPVSKLSYTFNMPAFYFALDAADARQALDMTGISAAPVDVAASNAQSLDMTLYRNVVRLDVVNADRLDITDLKIVNVPVTTGVENGTPNMAILGGTPASTYSLMKEVAGKPTCEGTRYCYPAANELQLYVTVGTGTKPVVLPLETVDGAKISLSRNHRYIINLRKGSESYVDANIVVADWNVGDNVAVDMESGQSTREPLINLIEGTGGMDSDNELAFWQGNTKVNTRMHDSYVWGATEAEMPSYCPWLRFDSPRIGSLGIRGYTGAEEMDYRNAQEVRVLRYPYNAIESEDGATVRNELAVVPFGNSCSFWLLLQNNYAPEKRRVLKVEVANAFRSSFGVYTPSLMRFAETNVRTDGTLAAFPEGGFDNPYGLVNSPVSDALRGQKGAGHTLPAEYALPSADQMRNISPDYDRVGRFDAYNGVDVYHKALPDDVEVYYSGSKRDKTVIKMTVEKSTNPTMTAMGLKYVSGTMWQYVSTPQGDYLKVLQLRSVADRISFKNYTALYDAFAGVVDKAVRGVVSRYFPADPDPSVDTYYLGDAGCAMKFSADGVTFVGQYVGEGYVKPVQTHLAWEEPAPVEAIYNLDAQGGGSGNPLILDGWTSIAEDEMIVGTLVKP